MATIDTPVISGSIDQKFFLTPLNGPENPASYLDNFPPQVYTHSLDSHLVKFMYSLMGPAGLGWIQKNYLDARLVLEDHGIEGFSLDEFYGDPLKFGRILEETYQRDLSGLISREKWNEIKAKDAKYRSRALNYVTGLRAGNTPLGMSYVAKSGLGHDVTIVENYKYLYDQHSDESIGLEYKGSTLSTEEMVVIPRHEIPASEVQKIELVGSPTEGNIILYFPTGDPSDPRADPTAATPGVESPENPLTLILTDGKIERHIIQASLESLPTIGPGNVIVEGGPLPEAPVKIKFINELSYKDVPELQVELQDMDGGEDPLGYNAIVTTETEGVSAGARTTTIAARDQHYLLTALNYVKPVTTIVTFTPGKNTSSVQTWNGYPAATSQYHEVVRYVTGRPTVNWPPVDANHWIVSGIEKKALRAFNDLQYHYQGFHNVIKTIAYTDEAVEQPDYETEAWTDTFRRYRSEHIGNFTNFQRLQFSYLNAEYSTYAPFSASNGVALYPEPLAVTASNTTTSDPTQLVNGIYAADYFTLPNAAPVSDSASRFWASKQRQEGSDYIEIDLGTVQAVNYLTFEVSNKPVGIEIDYDILDDVQARKFVPVEHNPDFSVNDVVMPDASNQNPWRTLEFLLADIVYTRYIRIKFTRLTGPESPFTSADGSLQEFSIDLKNLRLGRNI